MDRVFGSVWQLPFIALEAQVCSLQKHSAEIVRIIQCCYQFWPLTPLVLIDDRAFLEPGCRKMILSCSATQRFMISRFLQVRKVAYRCSFRLIA